RKDTGRKNDVLAIRCEISSDVDDSAVRRNREGPADAESLRSACLPRDCEEGDLCCDCGSAEKELDHGVGDCGSQRHAGLLREARQYADRELAGGYQQSSLV